MYTVILHLTNKRIFYKSINTLIPSVRNLLYLCIYYCYNVKGEFNTSNIKIIV